MAAAVLRALLICWATVPFSPARMRELPPTAIKIVDRSSEFVVRLFSQLAVFSDHERSPVSIFPTASAFAIKASTTSAFA